MNELKLNQLFAAARTAPAPVPPAEFAAEVVRVATQATPPGLPAARAGLSISEHLSALFPRLAVASVVLVLLCVAADWGLSASGLPGITDGMTQVTSQFLDNPEDL